MSLILYGQCSHRANILDIATQSSPASCLEKPYCSVQISIHRLNRECMDMEDTFKCLENPGLGSFQSCNSPVYLEQFELYFVESLPHTKNTVIIIIIIHSNSRTSYSSISSYYNNNITAITYHQYSIHPSVHLF